MGDNLLLILVLLLAGLVVLVLLLYVWKFMLHFTPLRFVNLFVRNAISKDLIDPNAPIEYSNYQQSSHILEAEAQAIKEQGFDGIPEQRVIPKARIVEDLDDDDETTSDSGYPVRLDAETRRKPRPFLDIHYGENENDDD